MSLLVITPSRGRPQQFGEMVAAVHRLSTEPDTWVAAGFDKDDPALTGYLQLIEKESFPRLVYTVGNRDTLSGWTNTLTRAHRHCGDYLASFGDDHLPRTAGWDTAFTRAIKSMDQGIGIVYGDDLAMGERLPTAPVVSRDIVERLGWFTYPKCGHYCVDNIWKDLGQGAGCLKYVPEVVIEHMHYSTGKSARDQTYQDAGGFTELHPDYAAYLHWAAGERSTDVQMIKDLIGGLA